MAPIPLKSDEEILQERASELTKRVQKQGEKYEDLGKPWPKYRQRRKSIKRPANHRSKSEVERV